MKNKFLERAILFTTIGIFMLILTSKFSIRPEDLKNENYGPSLSIFVLAGFGSMFSALGLYYTISAAIKNASRSE